MPSRLSLRPGALPVRTVLIPSERHAHVLRRALVRAGRREALTGTRFVRPVDLASDVLHELGVAFNPGEEALRAPRLFVILREGLALEHFDPQLLRKARGWNEAFASTITDLEGAGLSPDDLPRTTPRWRDLAAIWRRAEEAAGRSWSSARILREAAAAVERGSSPELGPILSIATGHDSAPQARFVRALRDVTLAILSARPQRCDHLRRIQALYGEDASKALEHPGSPSTPGTELEILKHYLFETPEVLADRDRPRSSGCAHCPFVGYTPAPSHSCR